MCDNVVLAASLVVASPALHSNKHSYTQREVILGLCSGARTRIGSRDLQRNPKRAAYNPHQTPVQHSASIRFPSARAARRRGS